MKQLKLAAPFISGVLIALSIPAAAQTFRVFFPDVQSTDYYSDSVESLTRLGILRGYDNGSFGPNDFVTRGQVAVMLDRYDEANVQPLREQIAQLRDELDLGECGDGNVQRGESCDDGNTLSGDGCTKYCQMERDPDNNLCGGHAVGDSFPSTDGCNTCTCTQSGIACTKMACSPPRDGCKVAGCSGQLCVEQEDDGISTCEYREEYACYKTATCERQTNGQCGWTQTAALRRCLGGSASSSDVACAPEQRQYEEIISQNAYCQIDADCSLFSYSCPFLTCGVGLNGNATDKATTAARAYSDCKQRAGEPVACAGCIQMRVACEGGRCVVRDQ